MGLLALSLGIWTSIAGAQATRVPDVLDHLLTAEKDDVATLGRLGDGPELMGYRAQLDADRRMLATQLQPLFPSATGSGWVDCGRMRQAMRQALTVASTTAGLEATLVMGLRVERFHCSALPAPAGQPHWSAGVPAALANLQGRLPASFTQTRRHLARTTAPQVMAAATARAFASGTSVCMADALAKARTSGERFQDAQRRAVNACVR